MLKNSNKFENRSHFSYNDYKKKVNKKTNQDMNVFVSVFFIHYLWKSERSQKLCISIL